MRLQLVAESLHGGLIVDLNNAVTDSPMELVLYRFGKRTHDVLIVVSRGPEDFVYPPFLLRWTELCDRWGTYAHGENKFAEQYTDPDSGIPFYAVGMPNPTREITWTQPCPEVAWSGDLVEHAYFSVLAAGSSSIPVQAVVSEGRLVLRIFLEYRAVTSDGYTSVWQDTDRVELETVPPGNDGTMLGVGAWSINRDLFNSGTYDIRIVAECTEESSSSPFDTSTSSTIRGIVDTKPPSLIGFESTSQTDSFSDGDRFTLRFSEHVVCSGFLVDGVTMARVDAQITYTGGSLTTASGQLDYACEGAEMTLSVLVDTISDENVGGAFGDAAGVQVRVFAGIYDTAGNPLEPVRRGLRKSRAAAEREKAGADVKSLDRELNEKLDTQHKAIVDTIGGNLTAMESKFTAMFTQLTSMLANASFVQGAAPGSTATLTAKGSAWPDCSNKVCAGYRATTAVATSGVW